MTSNYLKLPIGQKVSIPSHFDIPVILEAARPLTGGYECRLRLPDGTLEETVLSAEEAEELSASLRPAEEMTAPLDAEKIRLLIESARIRLAYAHDRQFAVSISGIRTLPHQIEAVYQKMLPQPRLRFLLADDPGAGKTIMAGLLIKEMKLREAIDRVLILSPAPLTTQWQDELLRWFGESFEVIFSALDQQQLVNPWQKNSQVIASIDYAKQEEVRERVWQQRWDLVIVDEAHKCSAYTRQRANRADEVERTKRYQLVDKIAGNSDHVLLLTATPHHGDDDRFGHFVRLIDPDVFPEPHKLGEMAREIRTDILRLGPECPWAARRLKEDLTDMEGQRLFPDRHATTISFKISLEEYELYKAVTAYINEYMAQGAGRKKQSVALARTVIQRRLASSTNAILESLQRRYEKLRKLLEELERLSPRQRALRLAQIQGRVSDLELEEDDLDDDVRDELFDEFTVAMELDQLRAEIEAVRELKERARRVKELGRDSKLDNLKHCLQHAEFHELKDGKGKLIIFTEHKDTLKYLVQHLQEWGFTTCEIHGGMNPHQRKRAQENFRTQAQVCIATEAAGEGINLQFCHLMINYDLPWNPTRLEQRLGRIHRIGQKHDVYVFNFVAEESEDGQPIIEGRILRTLLSKLDQMRDILNDRVFDVVGEVLSLNEINLPEMLREVAYDPRRLEDYLDQIQRMDAKKLKAYEEATGIALAKSSVDFSNFQRVNVEVEEKRLMPKYVESFFVKAASEVSLKVEPRADGLWRVPHVLADLRSDRLEATRHYGKSANAYRKVTFHKAHLEETKHLDAELMGPGHSLYAAVDEKLNAGLQEMVGGIGVFVDDAAERPYHLHFFEVSIRGQDTQGKNTLLFAELIAVREEQEAADVYSRFSIIPADFLLDLPGHPDPPEESPVPDIKPAADFVKTTHQMEMRQRCQKDREHFAAVCREYIVKSFDVRIRAAQDRVMQLCARERESEDMALARQRAENDLADLKSIKTERLAGLSRLSIARHGPSKHIATAQVLPLDQKLITRAHLMAYDADPGLRRKIETAAEDAVIKFETASGRECERVGHMKIGFDIRSLADPDPVTGYRDPVTGVRRIEVKGRKRGQPIRLTPNEWYKAVQLGDTYWLYVVWDPLEIHDPKPLCIQNPAKKLDYAKKEVVTARVFEIPADAVEAQADQ